MSSPPIQSINKMEEFELELNKLDETICFTCFAAILMIAFFAILFDSMYEPIERPQPELIDHCQPEIITTREKLKGK